MLQNNNLAALRYIPLKENNKTPLLNGWQEKYHLSIEDAKTLYPTSNLGVITGNGLVVVDVDNKNGKNGSKSLQEVPGYNEDDLDTYTVKTPTGGFHYYFKSEKDLSSENLRFKNKTNILEGIDIRGDGGYVVAPPSSIEDEPYSVLNQSNIKVLPEWISRLLSEAKPKSYGLTQQKTVQKRTKVKTSERSSGVGTTTAKKLSTRPLGSLTDLQNLIRYIDPNLSYEDWRNVLWSSVEAFGDSEDVIRTLDDWSKGSTKYEAGAIQKVIASYREDYTSGDPILRIKAIVSKYPNYTAFLPKIPAHQVPIAEEMAKNTAKNALDLLVRYENRPTLEHIDALGIVAKCLVYNGLTDYKSRLAIPLYTGGGKTMSIVGYLGELQRIDSDLGVWIAAGTLEQQEELRQQLMDCGIPKHKIGIRQANKTKNEVTKENARDFQFILVTHQKIKTHDIEYLLEYKGKQRQLIWDEAMIATSGIHISANRLVEQINTWNSSYKIALRDKNKKSGLTKFHRKTKDYLDSVEELLLDLVETNASKIELPEKDFGLMLDIYRHSDLELLDNPASRSLRTIETKDHGNILLSFVVEVPDILDRIVVLDASSPIRKLSQYDSSIMTVPIETTKDYSNVTINICRTNAGKYTVNNASKNRDLYKELAHVISECIPVDAEIAVFHVPEGDNQELVGERLGDFCSGSIPTNLRDLLSFGERSKPKFISWGKCKGVNKLVNVKYGTHIGMSFRNENELAASIAGQKRDIDCEISKTEVRRVQISEHVDQVYQAISRLACRKTLDGKAQETTFFLFHQYADQITKDLKKLMPNLNVVEYHPKHLKAIGKSRTPVVQEILGYLVSLDDEEKSVSISKVRKDLDIKVKPDSRYWKDTMVELKEMVQDAGYRFEGRSLVRL